MLSLLFTDSELNYMSDSLIDESLQALAIFRFDSLTAGEKFCGINRIREIGCTKSSECYCLYVPVYNMPGKTFAQILKPEPSSFEGPLPFSSSLYLAFVEKKRESPLSESIKKLKIGVDTPEQFILDRGYSVRLIARVENKRTHKAKKKV